MKKTPAPKDQRGSRARALVLDGRAVKTVLTFESRARIYCWSTDRPRSVIKH